MKRILATTIFSISLVSCWAQDTWTLERCIEHALKNNISIKQREDQVKQQEISLNTSKSQRLPGLNFGASEGLNFGRALTIDNTYANRNTQNTSFNISADVPLYTGGRIENDIKAKKLDLQTALAELDMARENVTLNIISNYLETVCQKELVTVAQHNLELSGQQVKRMESLFRNGRASEADLAQIRAAHASDELSLTQQQNSYMLSLLNLSQLLELPTPNGMEIESPKIDDISQLVLTTPDAIYNEALGIKPQIKAGELRIKNAETNIRIAQSGYYPNLSLGGGLGTSYYKSSGMPATAFGRQLKDNFSQYISLNLSFPIFNRFQTRNSVRTARVALHAQQLQQDETKKNLYKEIQQAYYNALASQKQCISSDAALESCRTSFNLVEKKYENGKANATEYQEAKTKLINAESTALQSRYTFIFRQKIIEFYRSGVM